MGVGPISLPSTNSVAAGSVLKVTGTFSALALIDADLRRPRISDTLNLKTKPGLSELLLGQATIKEALQSDRAKNLSVITAGMTTDPARKSLLAEGRMASVLTSLQAEFDMTIVDSPPLLVVSDAQFLSNCVSSTFLVVRWNDTQRDDVMKAVKHLRDSGAHLNGIVLNLVNLKSYAGYAYSKPETYWRIAIPNHRDHTWHYWRRAAWTNARLRRQIAGRGLHLP